jgi:predicted RNA-binding Zn ribbon-like protein
MFKLDDNLLRELGLGDLPAAEKNKMLAHIYETLEMRVGMTLAQQMTEAQLSEFETFIDSNDEAGALKWLETNFPNYKQVVADELEKLKAEIKAAAPQILAASQQPVQAQAPQQPPAVPPQAQAPPAPQAPAA